MIGAENQGLIGESKDVHTSPKVRQVLRDCLRQDSNDTVATTTARKEHQYEYFMRQLETVHLYYQNKANDYTMDNDTVSDWPWESRLSTEKNIGNVASILHGGNGMIEEVLGTLEEEDNVEDVGRASTGTVLARWDLCANADDETDNNEEEARTNDKKAASSSSSVQQGNVEELIFNDEQFDNVLEFTQEALTPPRTDTNSLTPAERKECHNYNALFSPEGVSFNGIDQMIPSQSQEEEEEEKSKDGTEEQQQLLLTQAETVDVSLTHSQSLHPEQYFSVAEDEDINNVKSQLSTPDIQHSQKKIESKKRKQVRYSHVIIESQLPITTMTRRQLDDEKDKDDASHDDASLTIHRKAAQSSFNRSNDSDDDTWLKVAKPKKRHNGTSTSTQPKSQVAGEGSEENSPQDDVVGVVAFGGDSQQNVGTKALNHKNDEQDQQTQMKKPSNELNTRAKANVPKVVQSQGKSVKEFDLDRFLHRSKRFCKR